MRPNTLRLGSKYFSQNFETLSRFFEKLKLKIKEPWWAL
jgi:hypothetical protein